MAKTVKSKLVNTVKNVGRTVNYVAIVLDESGSMDPLKSKTVEFLNNKIKELKGDSVKYDQDIYLTLVKFSYKPEVVFSNVDIHKVQEINNYAPGGNTALFAGVDRSISELRLGRQHSHYDNIAYLVVTITDGYENSSHHCGINVGSVVNLMRDLQQKNDWTFTFCLPKGYMSSFSSDYGVPIGNCMEWETTESGMRAMGASTQTAFSNYHATRSTGKKATKNFFADLSGVTTKDLKKLTDVSHLYKSYKVDGDYKIQDFVQSKTKKPYIPGTTYYELTKKETVQANKEILIVDKNNEKIVYGGREARDLLGIPHNEDVKLDPFDLGHHRVFILSSSVNRNLVRGTKVFVRK